MKWCRIILTSLFIFVFSAVGAQQLSREYMNVCNDFFRDLRKERRCAKLNCTTAIDWSDWENGARPDMEHGKNIYYKHLGFCDPPVDSIIFSKAELLHIEWAFQTQAYADWDAGNILDSITFFPKKYVDNITKIDKEKEPDAWKQGKFYTEHFPCGLYGISHPVFLRHNTLCIFYWSAVGLGDDLSIYVKTKKGWERFTELHHSIID